MTKKWKRRKRCTSISGPVYWKLREYVDKTGESLCGFADEAVNTKLTALGFPEETELVTDAPPTNSATTASKEHFSF